MRVKNLLFIFSDQHAKRVTGCYGDEVVATPHLDQLAAEGVAFDAAYCPSPICVPSRMAMLTARWPFRQACWTNDDVLPSGLPTWLHAMGARGTRPTLIGRLHAIGPDQLHGYAERQIGDHSPNVPGVTRQSLGVLTGANDPEPRGLANCGPGFSAYQAKDDAVTDAACEWIARNAEREASAGGFCLTVGLMLPHPPYVAEPEAFARYHGCVPPPRLAPPDVEHEFFRWWRHDRGVAAADEAAIERARAAYWALVEHTDSLVGRIVAALEAAGLADDTLIVYASDHGDHVGERGLFWKHTFYEESASVPLVMRLPGVLPAGERRTRPVNLIDLAASMVDALGAPTLPNADGRSFWAYARDGSAPWGGPTFCEYCTDPVPYWTGGRAVQQRMIRRGRHKLSIYDSGPPLLFDLAADPDEVADLAADPSHAPVRDALMAELTAEWDPEAIRARMASMRLDKDLLAAWAESVQPLDAYVWHFDPGINRLVR
ncbi:sulfatase-like hydrolase/transferase [Acuticoccus sp.]|uniref:sulfatase-like hydrolase/transferase n=1 Tax=Acuticoccus sp. TaxID=1904378 RepID=UPI003B52D383